MDGTCSFDGARFSALTAIWSAVEAEFSVTRRTLRSHRRDKPTVLARHACMWLTRRATDLSYPQIGQAFDRDHTTIMYAVSRTDQRMADDAAYARRVRRVMSEVRRSMADAPDR